MTKLSICIVNWETRQLLRQCLNSVFDAIAPADGEVVVVDNNSSDGSAAMVAREFPRARLIVNRHNRGFAAANNQAIRASGGSYVLLLNSDTVVLPRALEAMRSFMDSCPSAGICGAQLIGAHGEQQRSFWSYMPTVVSQIRHELPFLRPAEEHAPPAPPSGEAFAVARVPGACMMVRRATIEAIGLLDERFFFYAEDLDWCHRARAAGWGIYCVPQARVIHFGGQSSSRNSARFDLEFYKSRCRYFKKHYGAAHLALLRISLGLLKCLGLAKAALAYLARLPHALKRQEHRRNVRNQLLLVRLMLWGR